MPRRQQSKTCPLGPRPLRTPLTRTLVSSTALGSLLTALTTPDLAKRAVDRPVKLTRRYVFHLLPHPLRHTSQVLPRRERLLEIVGEIEGEEAIAIGGKIREIDRLRKIYGRGRWRKMKGVAVVRLPDGTTSPAEVHWYESHGVGRKEFKIKRLLGNLR